MNRDACHGVGSPSWPERKCISSLFLLADMWSTVCRNEEKLFNSGRLHKTRINVRRDLSGLEVGPDTFPARQPRGTRNIVVAHQYSVLAFGRFFYNRICAHIAGDYESLPELERQEATAPTSPLDDTISQEQTPALRMPLENALAPEDVAEALVATDGVGDDLQSNVSTKAKAKAMTRLRAAVTPRLNKSQKTEILGSCPKHIRSCYRDAVEQDVKDAARWSAQIYVTRNIVGNLKSSEYVSFCKPVGTNRIVCYATV